MADVVVTVPAVRWEEWIAEGDAPGEPWTGQRYEFKVPTVPALATPVGAAPSRVYVVALGKLRGYAPLLEIQDRPDGVYLIRGGDAVAVTISEYIRGFQGYRYTWWTREDERPLPDGRTP